MATKTKKKKSQKDITGAANIKLLKKIQANILAHPTLFIMEDWQEPAIDSFELIEDEKPDCGTACCIGGWALMEKGIVNRPLSKKNADKIDEFYGNMCFHDKNNNPLPSIDPYTEAKKILSLSDEQTSTLFMRENWPSDFRNAWDVAQTSILRAAIGAARIQYFIKTGK